MSKANYEEMQNKIIENENSTVIKLANGIMICTDIVSAGNYDTGYCLSTAVWNYPEKFIKPPRVFAQAIGGNSLAYTTLVGEATASMVPIQLKATSSSNAGTYVDTGGRGMNVMAIGRWK